MQGGQQPIWAQLIPFAVIALVMLLRFRNLKTARPLRLGALWIMPGLIVMVTALALVALPPRPLGWLLLGVGLLVGGLLGWQRARLTRLHIEGEGHEARVMMRQSPAALILIIAIFAGRRLLLPSGMSQQAEHGHPAATALLATDAALGFAVGMVCVLRLMLWLRARTLAAEHHAANGPPRG